MTGIYPAALLATVAALALWGVTLPWTGPLSRAVGRRVHVLAFVLGLPLSALVNLLVKAPVGLPLVNAYGLSTPAVTLFLLVFGALAAEAVKMAPALLPPLRRAVASGRAAAFLVGGALGLGFGVGEVFYLAVQLNLNPQVAAMPAALFGGFFAERFRACLIHLVMTAVAVTLLSQRRGLLGLLAAGGLHTALNLGAVLRQAGVIGELFTWAWFLGGLVVSVVILDRLRRAAGSDRRPDGAGGRLSP